MTAAGEPSPLTAICSLTRLSLGAASVSVAIVHDDGLHYVAADGAGATAIVGTHLPAGTGIAGIVAATGQSISVRDPASDPRFARDVGERTGYVPNAIRCIAVLDPDGDVAAVLSILDQGTNFTGTENVGSTNADGADAGDTEAVGGTGANGDGAGVSAGATAGTGAGAPGVLELILELAAALVPAGDDDGSHPDSLDRRLARLASHDRSRATALVAAVLDAFES